MHQSARVKQAVRSKANIEVETVPSPPSYFVINVKLSVTGRASRDKMKINLGDIRAQRPYRTNEFFLKDHFFTSIFSHTVPAHHVQLKRANPFLIVIMWYYYFGSYG